MRTKIKAVAKQPGRYGTQGMMVEGKEGWLNIAIPPGTTLQECEWIKKGKFVTIADDVINEKKIDLSMVVGETLNIPEDVPQELKPELTKEQIAEVFGEETVTKVDDVPKDDTIFQQRVERLASICDVLKPMSEGFQQAIAKDVKELIK